ncbi:MAG: type II secretion system F family protein [Candidatus Dormibacteria bacterium]
MLLLALLASGLAAATGAMVVLSTGPAPIAGGEQGPVTATWNRLEWLGTRLGNGITGWRGWLPGLTLGLLAAGGAYAVLGLALPSLVVGGLGWTALGALARWRELGRRARQREALVSAVDLLGQLLPAGHGVRQSLQALAESGPPELRPELTQVLDRMRETSLEQALLEGQLRLRQPLFTLVATTLAVGGRSGGRLTPLLEELSRAAHQIESTQSQLRAEQAQGRFGALVIALMPLGLIVVLRVVNPSYLDPYGTLPGQLVLALLLTAIVVGYLWMLRILRIPDLDLIDMAEAQSPRPRQRTQRDPLSVQPDSSAESIELPWN